MMRSWSFATCQPGKLGSEMCEVGDTRGQQPTVAGRCMQSSASTASEQSFCIQGTFPIPPGWE